MQSPIIPVEAKPVAPKKRKLATEAVSFTDLSSPAARGECHPARTSAGRTEVYHCS